MNKKQIGKLIVQLCGKSGLTYYAIAKGSKVSEGQIKAIEAGEKAYTIDSLIKLCDFFKLKIELTQPS